MTFEEILAMKENDGKPLFSDDDKKLLEAFDDAGRAALASLITKIATNRVLYGIEKQKKEQVDGIKKEILSLFAKAGFEGSDVDGVITGITSKIEELETFQANSEDAEKLKAQYEEQLGAVKEDRDKWKAKASEVEESSKARFKNYLIDSQVANAVSDFSYNEQKLRNGKTARVMF